MIDHGDVGKQCELGDWFAWQSIRHESAAERSKLCALVAQRVKMPFQLLV